MNDEANPRTVEERIHSLEANVRDHEQAIGRLGGYDDPMTREDPQKENAMTIESEPLSPEEEGMLDALDAMPERVLALVRSRLPGYFPRKPSRDHAEALLDKLSDDIASDPDGFDGVELREPAR